MLAESYNKPGSQVVYREVWQGKVWTARPVIVVQDTRELIVLYLPRGTRWKVPAGRREQYFDYLRTGAWPLADVTWLPGDTLFLIPPDEAHAIHLTRKPEHQTFTGWGINLQEPIRRTTIGFDSMDQELDIDVTPDLTEWRWKDEDHLQRAQADGRYSPEQILAIRTEGERVIARVQAKASPFGDGWNKWTPPEEWPIPALPEGWNEVRQ